MSDSKNETSLEKFDHSSLDSGILPKEAFRENNTIYKPKVTGAIKVTEPGQNEEFILKNFRKNSWICSYEKLCYDLLQLCGVKVPETFLVYDAKNEHYLLASKKEQGYQDLHKWLPKN